MVDQLGYEGISPYLIVFIGEQDLIKVQADPLTSVDFVDFVIFYDFH